MTEPRIELTVDDGVATLRMADPSGRNAFSRPFIAELQAALAEVRADERIAACVLAGLPEVFSAGGDREVLVELAEGRMKPYDLTLTRALLDIPVPTVAAMAGPAVGGGLIFGLSCDIVLLGRRSRYGCNFLDLGFTPGMGTTRLLQAAFGEYVAAEMMFGCQYFRGRDLERVALVNGVFDAADVERQAQKRARRFAEKPRHALVLLKRALVLPRRRAFEEALVLEAAMHEACFSRPETRERILESYLEPTHVEETC